MNQLPIMKQLNALSSRIRSTAEEMEDLDKKIEKLVHEVEVKVNAMVENQEAQTNLERALEYRRIRRLADEADALGAMKVALAEKMVQAVGKQIKNLDRQTSSLQDAQQKDEPEHETTNAVGSSKKKTVATKSYKKKEQRNKEKLESVSSLRPSKRASSNSIDLPADPSEATYCVCNQVAFGRMIACDNPKCEIEWFHFGCVGLKRSPPDDWCCDQCKGLGKKKLKLRRSSH